MNRLGWAWLALCSAFAAHVFDENATGFLSVYNPTVTELRHRLGWWPMPTFEHGEWLWGLIAGVVLVFLLSPFAFRGASWWRGAGPPFHSESTPEAAPSLSPRSLVETGAGSCL